jgi:single-stranded DNA-binding protein
MTIECAMFGSLVADAEHRTSKNGRPYVRFRLAVGSGNDVQFASVMLFDNVDELADARKGTRVYVEGRIRLDKWTGQDGADRHGLSVMSSFARAAEIGARKKRRSLDDARPEPPPHVMPPI